MIFHADGCGVYGGPTGCDCGAAGTENELARLRKQVADLKARLKESASLAALISWDGGESLRRITDEVANLKLKSWRKGGK